MWQSRYYERCFVQQATRSNKKAHFLDLCKKTVTRLPVYGKRTLWWEWGTLWLCMGCIMDHYMTTTITRAYFPLIRFRLWLMYQQHVTSMADLRALTLPWRERITGSAGMDSHRRVSCSYHITKILYLFNVLHHYYCSGSCWVKYHTGFTNNSEDNGKVSLEKR